MDKSSLTPLEITRQKNNYIPLFSMGLTAKNGFSLKKIFLQDYRSKVGG